MIDEGTVSLGHLVLQYLNYAGFAYFLGTNTVYLLLVVLAFLSIRRQTRTSRLVTDKLLFRHAALFKPVSIVAPAFNEELTVQENVRSLLTLSYPEFEVILVNDGSSDGTLEVLRETYALQPAMRAAPGRLATKPVRQVYQSQLHDNLIVVDKENGGKADALNAGINYSRYSLFTAIDTDSLLEKDVLLKMVRPFLESPSTVAVGGLIRVVNGCEVHDGEVVRVGLPQGWLATFQVIEYLRAFLFGRTGWAALNMLVIISGAFGMFSKSAVIAAGGYRHTVGEDIELVVRLHRQLREQGQPYRVRFIPDPVCWTEVPESISVLARQRNRWTRGLLDSTWMHRVMLFNPRYGGVGMISLPFHLLVEALGWIVELAGVPLLVVAWSVDAVGLRFVTAFLSVSVLMGVLVSLSVLILDELAFRRFPGLAVLAKLFLFGVLENFGYRQLNVWWRMRGTVDFWRGKSGWGAITRTGFSHRKPKG